MTQPDLRRLRGAHSDQSRRFAFVGVLIAISSGCVQRPPCQDNPMFFLKGTVADCAAVAASEDLKSSNNKRTERAQR